MNNRLVITLFTFCFCNILFAQEPKLILPIGHAHWLHSAQFSPDKKTIVTVSRDKTAKIWDVASGKLLKDLTGHTFWIHTVQFSPDGKKIVTASRDKTAKIWDVASGKLLANLTGHTYFVYDAQFSPDGKKIVTASGDKTAKIWDASSGKLLKNLTGHTGSVHSVQFSPDGKKIVSASWDKTGKTWDVSSGKLLVELKGHTDSVYFAQFSPDGKKIITASGDKTAKIWDASSGKLLVVLSGHKGSVTSIQFSPEGNKIITASEDKTVKIWNTDSGKLLANLDRHSGWVRSAQFSPDGKKIVSASRDSTVKLWDAGSGNLIADLIGHSDNVRSAQFSPDGKKIVSASDDNTAKIWDASSGQLLANLTGFTYWVSAASFSSDGKKIITASWDKIVKIWDAGSGRHLVDLNGHTGWVSSVQFSSDGKKIVTASWDNTAKIWDAVTGNLLADLTKHTAWITSVQFSSDGKKVLTASWDNTAKIWDAVTGNLLLDLTGHTDSINSAQFSPDGKKIVTASVDKTAKIWDVNNGNLLMKLSGHTSGVLWAQFSPDGKKIVTASVDKTAKIWDVSSGNLQMELSGHTDNIRYAQFSPDGKKVATASEDNTAKIWDVNSGTLLKDLTGHTSSVNSAEFSPDGKKIITASWDNTAKIWDAGTGILLYTFLPLGEKNFLVVDKNNRFDGTESARKHLYFACGNEVIELEQLKDQLWVPNLAERIMKGDSINAPKLSDLNICGLTPEVEEVSISNDTYHFKILSRRGGLGETVLYINGIEVKRYKKEDLKNKTGTYELVIKKQELGGFLIAGQENPVTVKAWIADNTISSRGLIIKEDKTKEKIQVPNLYAVIVGVSDYKGNELDLKYAAKDATDISNALSVASRKLLNTDSREHVFTYNLTTTNDRYLLPEKKSIKKTLEEIGNKATANDILLIFFAGHGIMDGNDKKQFYFLTADASKSSAMDAIAEVGISTAELTEWMKPASIKAQKRILIFDACNSGQVIRDFVQLGKPEQGYVAARSDEKGQQIKAIEKLNNQSGLIILAASASDQNAYEMGRYSQGLLTYSLLKVMKQQPEILENGKYLDVSNWLNAAKKMVSTLAEGTGARQEPQLNSNNNFNIGLIDEEVRNKIILADEKPLFARSNFQNSDTKIDNLKFRSAIDKELMNISSRGTNADITYSADYEGADAFALTGDYKIIDDSVTVNVLLVKGGTEVKHNYEFKGKLTELNSLISNITSTALDWLKNNK